MSAECPALWVRPLRHLARWLAGAGTGTRAHRACAAWGVGRGAQVDYFVKRRRALLQRQRLSADGFQELPPATPPAPPVRS